LPNCAPAQISSIINAMHGGGFLKFQTQKI
jgi:hypothetical protein